ncbi:MAG: hypothetical protein GXO75_09605 [Calditrichaeota bacterium]|nr:hypothetical protein [Calditrichota bacterium]
MRHYKANLSVILSLLFIIAGCSIRNKPAASIHVPRVFSDNMVLQREIKVPVWGTAKPGGRVTVQFGKQIKKTRVSDQGKWQIDLAPLTAGGPYELNLYREKWGKIAEQRIAAVGGYNHGWEKPNYNAKNWHKMELFLPAPFIKP